VTFAPKVAGPEPPSATATVRSTSSCCSRRGPRCSGPRRRQLRRRQRCSRRARLYRRAQACATQHRLGAWSGVGMAARLDERDRRRMAARPGTIAPDEAARCSSACSDRLDRGSPCCRCAGTFLRAGSGRRVCSGSGGRPGPRGDAEERQGRPLVARLREAPASRRRGLLLAHVQRLAARVLGVAPDAAIDPMRPLREMGLDSLMAVELRNGLARDMETRLPATLLFDHPTLTGSLTPSAAVPGLRAANRRGRKRGPRRTASRPSRKTRRARPVDELESLRGGDRG
jgi:hypothetical protein